MAIRDFNVLNTLISFCEVNDTDKTFLKDAYAKVSPNVRRPLEYFCLWREPLCDWKAYRQTIFHLSSWEKNLSYFWSLLHFSTNLQSFVIIFFLIMPTLIVVSRFSYTIFLSIHIFLAL